MLQRQPSYGKINIDEHKIALLVFFSDDNFTGKVADIF